MRIDIWADVICPYCYIGKAELEKAIAGRTDIEIVHHAFRLSPDTPTEPVSGMLAKKYGMNEAQVAKAHSEISDRAASVGLTFNTDGALSGDTRMAHRLLLAAQARGKDLSQALYRAYFTDQKNVFELDDLTDVAVANGFTAEEAQSILTNTQFDDALEADEAQARSLNIRGVPFFVFDNAVAVSGAQPAATFTEALEIAASRAVPTANA